MELPCLLNIVRNSSIDNWYDQRIATSCHAPSYSPIFPKLAVYRNNIDISLAYPAFSYISIDNCWSANANPPWSDPQSFAALAYLRYKGQPIYKIACVTVDGYSYLIPKPRLIEDNKYAIDGETMMVAHILFDLYLGVGYSRKRQNDIPVIRKELPTIEAVLKQNRIFIIDSIRGVTSNRLFS